MKKAGVMVKSLHHTKPPSGVASRNEHYPENKTSTTTIAPILR